ncbi:MAG: hypothetical protein EZS28_013052, partial [Streblomastix strix]
LDNEEDEEQERTLLEEIEHERSNVEQRIPSLVGVLSPGLSHLEFSQPLSCIHITQSQSTNEIEDTFQPFLQYSRTLTQVMEVVGKRNPLPYGIKTQKQRKNNSEYNQSQ